MHLVIGHIAHQSRNRWFAQRPYNLPGMNQFYEKETPFKRGSVMDDYGASLHAAPLVFCCEGKHCFVQSGISNFGDGGFGGMREKPLQAPAA